MKYLNLFVIALAFLFGCESNHVDTRIVAVQYLMNADDLDLEMITGHLKDINGEVNAEALESWINSTRGVDNVDLDNDHIHDIITVKEEVNNNGRTFSLTANPKTGSPVVAAELQFSKSGNQTLIEASYPDYVQGGSDRLYRAISDNIAFNTWLWAVRPTYYYPPAHYSTFLWAAPAPVLDRQTLSTTRTITKTSTTVSPVKRESKPAQYQSHSSEVQKVQALRQERAPSTSITSTAGAGANFTRRNDATPKPAATNVVRSQAPPASTPKSVSVAPTTIAAPRVQAATPTPKPAAAVVPSRPMRSSSSTISSGTKR